MSLPERPLVSAIVVTYNSSDDLAGCLSRLPDAFAGVDYEVIVVDNASTDGSAVLAERLAPAAKVLRLGRNAGYAAGINRGVAAASSRAGAYLVLNPDTRLLPGSVLPLWEALQLPGVGLAVPRLLDEHGAVGWSLRRAPSVSRMLGEALLGGRAGRFALLGEQIRDPTRYERPGTCDWATGAAMAISAACWGATGGWDESFGLYSEETEYCLRANRHGYRLRFVPDAQAEHRGPGSAPAADLWARLVANKLRLFRRQGGRLRAPAFKLALLLHELLRTSRPRHRAGLRAVVAERSRPESAPRSHEAPGYICFSAQDWWYFNRAHSDFQLMIGVAAHRKVLFVNSIAMRMPLPGRSTRPVRRLLRKAGSMAHAVRRPVRSLPNFYVMTPLTVPFYGSARARALNARLVRAQVTAVARLIDLPADPVLVVTIPTAWDVVQSMPRRSLIYNRSDRHSAFAEACASPIARLENELLVHSDRVLYVSRSLMASEEPMTAGRGVFIDHGVDLGHFLLAEGLEAPADIQAIPRPRLGFFGSFNDYTVDMALLRKVAVGFPEASLVLIGKSTVPMGSLEELPNVHWLGYRPYEQIPAYGSAFDIGLMPWLQNDWIRDCNPIKMKEYLALGLPVVSMEFPEVHRYVPLVEVATSHAEFLEKVDRVLHRGDPELSRQRRAAVRADGWSRRATDLIALAERG